jgi:hypothetical protein
VAGRTNPATQSGFRIGTGRIFPVAGAADRCAMQLDLIVPDPLNSDRGRRHWERNLDLTIRTVLNEDFATAEGIHRNGALGSPAQAVFGLDEPALALFERTVNEQFSARAEARVDVR